MLMSSFGYVGKKSFTYRTDHDLDHDPSAQIMSRDHDDIDHDLLAEIMI